MRRIRTPKAINTARDFIRKGYCDQCRQDEQSIVVHHPQRGRPFTVCRRCHEETWIAVGQSNINNWLTTGRVTEWVPRNKDNRRGRDDNRRDKDHDDKSFRSRRFSREEKK